MGGWVGVDLDATLAEYAGWQGEDHIGAPIPKMVKRVQDMLANGTEVRIFTARVAFDEDGSNAARIKAWCLKHIGQELEVTNVKDYGMIELYDDRAWRVVANTGEIYGGDEWDV